MTKKKYKTKQGKNNSKAEAEAMYTNYFAGELHNPVELTIGTLGLHVLSRLMEILEVIDRDFSKVAVDRTAQETGVDFKGTFRNGHRAGCYYTSRYIESFARHWIDEIAACNLGMREELKEEQ